MYKRLEGCQTFFFLFLVLNSILDLADFDRQTGKKHPSHTLESFKVLQGVMDRKKCWMYLPKFSLLVTTLDQSSQAKQEADVRK